MSDFEIEIKRYLKNLPPDVLGLGNTNSIEILDMFSGAYNLNYHVRANKKEFIFRINIEQQSGLNNQIEYEDKVLRFLEGYNIAPKTYYVDNTLKYFAFNLRPKIGHDNLLELHHFYIIKNTKGKTFINSEKNKLYTTLDAKFSIIAYTVYGNQLLFVETDLLTPSNFIDLEKKKREKIFIEYSRLEVD